VIQILLKAIKLEEYFGQNQIQSGKEVLEMKLLMSSLFRIY
jgi:hypothetical protein